MLTPQEQEALSILSRFIDKYPMAMPKDEDVLATLTEELAKLSVAAGVLAIYYGNRGGYRQGDVGHDAAIAITRRLKPGLCKINDLQTNKDVDMGSPAG